MDLDRFRISVALLQRLGYARLRYDRIYGAQTYYSGGDGYLSEHGETAGAQSGSALSRLVRSLNPVSIIGLACAQAWMTARWFPLTNTAVLQENTFAWLIALSCFVAMGSFVVCALFARHVERFLCKKSWKLFVLFWSLASAISINCETFFSQTSGAWPWITAVITGIGSGLLLLTWVIVCVRAENVMNISLAFLLSSIMLSLSFDFTDFFLRGTAGVMVLSVVLALASAILLLFEPTSWKIDVNYSIRRTNKTVFHYMGKVCVGAFLVGLANEFVMFIYSNGPALLVDSNAVYWVVALVLMAINAGIAWQRMSHKTSRFYFLCRGAIVLCVVSALLLPHVEGSALLMSLNTAGRQCLQLLIWIIVCLLYRKHHFSPVVLFGSTCSVWYLGSLVGILMHQAAAESNLFTSEISNTCLSIGAVLLLVLAFAFLFSERDSDVMFGGDAGSSVRTKAFRRGCDYLIEKGNLTKREGEILYLLAKGASVAHIEEKLFITSSTVATHMKHIYQKLDIHSRQELYDRVEQSSRQFYDDSSTTR